MNTDLTKHAPRSPKEALGGIVSLPRFIDKVRALNEGTLGEYISGLNSAVDKNLLSFLGISYDDIKAEILKTDSDTELLNWISNHGTAHTPEEIKMWSENFSHLLAKNDPDRQNYIGIVLQKMNLDPETTTTFDWIEADDKATFNK